MAPIDPLTTLLSIGAGGFGLKVLQAVIESAQKWMETRSEPETNLQNRVTSSSFLLIERLEKDHDKEIELRSVAEKSRDEYARLLNEQSKGMFDERQKWQEQFNMMARNLMAAESENITLKRQLKEFKGEGE
jgi:hypothetical protein